MERLIKDIISKKELQNLEKETVQQFLEEYFKEHPEIKDALKQKEYNSRSKEYKEALKEVRKKLREIYGAFIQKDYLKKEKLLEKINKNNKEEIISRILQLHKSSKERLLFYKEIYERIFDVIGMQEKILDLGCGLNPLSCIWIPGNPKYVASDISSQDLKFIQKFFKQLNLPGKTIRLDLIKEYEALSKIDANVTFLFKTLDTLESISRDISKKIIRKIKSDWIIVSFPKKSLGRKKKISKNARKWFLNFLKNENLTYEEFEVKNEYFIIIDNRANV